MSDRSTTLDKVVELVLTTGLLVSGAFLLVGLVRGSASSLRAGILLLMLTPLARVVVVTAGLFRRKDWFFALASLWILGVLLSSLWVAYRLERDRARSGVRGATTLPLPPDVGEG